MASRYRRRGKVWDDCNVDENVSRRPSCAYCTCEQRTGGSHRRGGSRQMHWLRLSRVVNVWSDRAREACRCRTVMTPSRRSRPRHSAGRGRLGGGGEGGGGGGGTAVACMGSVRRESLKGFSWTVSGTGREGAGLRTMGRCTAPCRPLACLAGYVISGPSQSI